MSFFRNKIVIAVILLLAALGLGIGGFTELSKVSGEIKNYYSMPESEIKSGTLVEFDITEENYIGQFGYRDNERYYFVWTNSDKILTFKTEDKEQKNLLLQLEQGKTGSISLTGQVSPLADDEKDVAIDMLKDTGFFDDMTARQYLMPYKIGNYNKSLPYILLGISGGCLLIGIILFIPFGRKNNSSSGVSNSYYNDINRPYTGMNNGYNDPNQPYGGTGGYNDPNQPYGGTGGYNDPNQPYGGMGGYNDPNQPYGGTGGYNDPNQPYGGTGGYNDPNQPYGGTGSYGNSNSTYGGTGGYGNSNSTYGGTGSYGNSNSTYGGTGGYGNSNSTYGGTGSYGNSNNTYGGIGGYGNNTSGIGNNQDEENKDDDNNNQFPFIKTF